MIATTTAAQITHKLRIRTYQAVQMKMDLLFLWVCILLCLPGVFPVPLSAPVGRITSEDMGTADELDKKAMQGLLRKLWEYEAETWRDKYEATEKRRAFLEQRLEGLVSDLQKCERSARSGDDRKLEDDTRSEGDKWAKNDKEFDSSFLIVQMGQQEAEIQNGGDINIRITSPHDDDVTVHVTQDENVAQHVVPPQGAVQVPLSNRARGTDVVTTLLKADKAVRAEIVTANGSSAEGYIVIPISTLDSEYSLKEAYPYAVVSTADNTRVKVQDSAGSEVYSLLLNQGQTFLTPTGKGPNFAGGRISSQNPLAVFAVRPTQCNNGGCSASDLQVLRSSRLNIKAWNDCLASPTGCNDGRPRPGRLQLLSKASPRIR